MSPIGPWSMKPSSKSSSRVSIRPWLITSSKIRWISCFGSGMFAHLLRRGLGNEAECGVHLRGVEVLGECGCLAVAECPHVDERDLERDSRNATTSVPADRDDGVGAVDEHRRLNVQFGVVLGQLREELPDARRTRVRTAKADR